MAEKSAKKGTAKTAVRSLKEKRLDKKEKASSKSHSEDAVSNVKKR
ncbi:MULTISPECIES: hypothetical protein [unclassified Frondihabitans]|jgi:hypothetical protein|nr:MULTISPECIES: hypothetical protein [unclassified Frondihabitans]RPE78836.1 hypothetical protein EDF37_1517 [Frondihabitans sp. PhB153]RPF09117.1 hypothetical protein EDF39_1519 [Frondihabitans sp. PhB161]